MPIRYAGHPKEGLFHGIVRAHAKAGFDTAVLSITGGDSLAGKVNDRVALQESCHSLGVDCLSKEQAEPLIRPLLASVFGLCVHVLRDMPVSTLPTWIKYSWRYRGWLSAFDRYIRDHGRPDLLSAVHGCEDAGILAFLLSKRFGIPFIVFERKSHYRRGVLSRKRLASCRWVCKTAKVVLPNSHSLKDQMEKALGIEMSHSTVVPDVVPDESFSPPKRPDWIHNFRAGRVLFAAWTNWRDIKRLDLLIYAFERVHNGNEQTCLIVGGPVPDWVTSEVQRRGLSEAVLLAGDLDREEVQALAHACNACVVPSDFETFGLPVIEAHIAGKPVIATRCGGPESIITDRSLGTLVDKGDVEAMARAMSDMTRQIEQYDSQRIAAECARHYSEQSLAERLRDIYSSVNAYGATSASVIGDQRGPVA